MQATKTNKKTIAQSLQEVMRTKGLPLTFDNASTIVNTVFQAFANAIEAITARLAGSDDKQYSVNRYNQIDFV